MNAVGLVFADSYDVNMDELTEKRTHNDAEIQLADVACPFRICLGS